MSSSLTRDVTLRASVVLAGALAVVGLATGAGLHLEALRGRDQLLLAAARAGVAEEGVEAEGDAPFRAVPVRTSYDPGAVPGLPPEWYARAQHEEVVVGDVGRQRVLLQPVEREDDDDDEEDDDAHREHPVVIAWAPRVSVAESVGPFVLTYAAVALVAAAGAVGVLHLLLRRALASLDRAARAAGRLDRLGGGERLPEEGPAEVRALPAAVNALLERLEHAWAAQARFTAEAAHELRTPLAAVSGEIEVALRRPRDAAAYREALERAGASTRRLTRLVEALLALARVDAGQVEADREPVRAGELLLGTLDAERAGLERAGCRVEVDLRDDPPLLAHRPLLGAALGNLLRNAARYAPGTLVRCRLERDADRCRFVVEDGGPGVPEAEREALFDRFARAGSARRDAPEGLGLGLAFAREVARRHGGDCGLDAAPGGGTRAWIVVPVATDPPSDR